MSFDKLPAELFSPAKMVFMAYIVLAATKVLAVTQWQFVIASALFLVIEIGHNDYLRIRLNVRANEPLQRS